MVVVAYIQDCLPPKATFRGVGSGSPLSSARGVSLRMYIRSNVVSTGGPGCVHTRREGRLVGGYTAQQANLLCQTTPSALSDDAVCSVNRAPRSTRHRETRNNKPQNKKLEKHSLCFSSLLFSSLLLSLQLTRLQWTRLQWTQADFNSLLFSASRLPSAVGGVQFLIDNGFQFDIDRENGCRLPSGPATAFIQRLFMGRLVRNVRIPKHAKNFVGAVSEEALKSFSAQAPTAGGASSIAPSFVFVPFVTHSERVLPQVNGWPLCVRGRVATAFIRLVASGCRFWIDQNAGVFGRFLLFIRQNDLDAVLLKRLQGA